MDANTVALVVGLAGILGTLISSGLGLYFTSKARSSPLQEMLYSKQIDLIVRIISKVGRFKVFATMLADPDSNYKDITRDDIDDCVKNISKLKEEGAAILPVELWVEVKKLSNHAASILSEYDESQNIDSEQFIKFSAMGRKVALLARAVLGVDELTEESIKIFSSKKEFDAISKNRSHKL